MASNLFYQHYDDLFTAKDYESETNAVLDYAAEFLEKPPEKVLEVGCGTGNHSFELAAKVKSLMAIDIDENMIALALQKNEHLHIKNIEFRHESVSEVKDGSFDLALALFNVITYIGALDELIDFFSAVKKHLSGTSLFIFDCWNGVAAIKDPPKSKHSVVSANGKDITCNLRSETDFFNRKTRLTYRIDVRDEKGHEESDKFSFEQTLWTYGEVCYALNKAGMEVVVCCKHMDFSRKASDGDWKIVFAAKPY